MQWLPSDARETGKISAIVARHVKEMEEAEAKWKTLIQDLKKKQREEYREFVLSFYAIESQKTVQAIPKKQSTEAKSDQRVSIAPIVDKKTAQASSPKRAISFFGRKSKAVSVDLPPPSPSPVSTPKRFVLHVIF
jgi:hypothetical protein